MITLYLIRGERGVGKSTVAASLIKPDGATLLFEGHRYGMGPADRLVPASRFFSPQTSGRDLVEALRGRSEGTFIACGDRCEEVYLAVRQTGRPHQRIEIQVYEPVR